MRKTDYHRTYNKDRYRRRRADFIARLGGLCRTCGATKRLEIDHIDPALKQYSVGQFWALREETVEAELKKCQLLCHACHVRKTRRDNGQADARLTHGTLSSYRYCKCQGCRAAKAAYMRQYKSGQTPESAGFGAKSVPKLQ